MDDYTYPRCDGLPIGDGGEALWDWAGYGPFELAQALAEEIFREYQIGDQRGALSMLAGIFGRYPDSGFGVEVVNAFLWRKACLPSNGEEGLRPC